jgi:NADPH-dependent glutamate synthase beta subunit-like oxidoreductase
VDNANADKVEVPKNAPSTGKRVAIVGGGPSGLTAAYFLQIMGHQTTVFEEKEKLGGMLRYGIPNYRFPRERLQQDIDAILSTGVEVKLGVNIGKDITIEQLHKEYDAVYIAIGAHTEKKLRIDGVGANGVYSAVNLLREVGYDRYPDFTGRKVVVIGGGNVAMDCARTAIRANADKVSVVYRRRQKDMTALAAEIESAIAESVELLTLKAPLRIETDENNNAIALWVQPQISGTHDKEGRPRPLNAAKEEERIACDVILMAVGQDVVSKHFEEYGIPVQWNCLQAKEDTSFDEMPGIFAGGDCATGPSTVIMAIAAGKTAAANIDNYLGYNHEISCDVEIPQPKLNNKLPSGRVHLTEREACERKHDFDGVENNISLEEALQESARCLRCDHFGCGILRGGREEKW